MHVPALLCDNYGSLGHPRSDRINVRLFLLTIVNEFNADYFRMSTKLTVTGEVTENERKTRR
jgi:hypothetical protein